MTFDNISILGIISKLQSGVLLYICMWMEQEPSAIREMSFWYRGFKMRYGTISSFILVLLGVVFSIQISVSAQDFENSYIGAAGGIYNLSIRGADGVDDDVVDFDEKSFAYKVYGGRRFSKHLGLELSVVDYGEPEGSVFGDDLTVDEWGSTLHGVLHVPTELQENVTYFAKAGPAWINQDVDAEATVSGNTVKISKTGSGWGASFAAGANILLSSDLSLRFEAEGIFEVDDDVDTDRYIGFVGLQYHFRD